MIKIKEKENIAESLKGRSLLTLKDYSPREIKYLLELSKELKEKKKSGGKEQLLKGKNIVLLFEKTSTRTRCAFEVAVADEGGHTTYLNISDGQMFHKESVEDTAKVLGRMYDGIQFRGFEQKTVELLAKHSGVPVWNGLTDSYHPTQVLADLLTITEHIDKPLNKIKFVYVGDARNNMANSLLIGTVKMGMHFVALGPKSLYPDEDLVNEMKDLAKKTGANILLTEDMQEAAKDADVIYTDVWVSMGEEAKMAERIKLLKPYQVNMDMINATNNSNVIFMHCLPAFHNLETTVAREVYEKFQLSELEVTDEVFKSKYSVVFDQAENRLHTIKAIMVATMK